MTHSHLCHMHSETGLSCCNNSSCSYWILRDPPKIRQINWISFKVTICLIHNVALCYYPSAAAQKGNCLEKSHDIVHNLYMKKAASGHWFRLCSQAINPIITIKPLIRTLKQPVWGEQDIWNSILFKVMFGNSPF